ncbi:hypothetical protein Tco_0730824 [Tanacetum coccineum]
MSASRIRSLQVDDNGSGGDATSAVVSARVLGIKLMSSCRLSSLTESCLGQWGNRGGSRRPELEALPPLGNTTAGNACALPTLGHRPMVEHTPENHERRLERGGGCSGECEHQMA